MYNISRRNDGVVIETTTQDWSMAFSKRPMFEVAGKQLTFFDSRNRVSMNVSEISLINGVIAPVLLTDTIILIRDGVLAADDADVAMLGAIDQVFKKMVVGTSRDKFRDEFFSFDTINNWDLIQTGSGQAITVGGVTAGSRYLNVNTGVNINSETIIQSKNAYKLPLKLAFGLSMSQRIINQEVFVELVSVNALGVVEVDATFPSTNLNNATNAAGYKFDNVTATNALWSVRGYGISELAAANTGVTISTTANGTGPNYTPAGIFEINLDMEEAVFQTRSIDSLAAANTPGKRTQYLPDPMKDYKVRIRVRNLSTAPTSATDVRLHFLRVLDTTRFTVDFARHMGRSNDVGDSLPVAVTSMPGVTVNAMTRGQLDRLQVVDIASAAITSTTTSGGISIINSQAQSFGLTVTAVSGTSPTMDVIVQESLDGTNWKDLYHFERVTANTYLVSPMLQVKGYQIRYVRNVAGTTPSFTMAMTRVQCSTEGEFVRRIFDRTINPLTASSPTPAMDCEGATSLQLTVSTGTVTTSAPTYQLQMSEDGASWTNIGTALVGVQNAQVATAPTPFMGKYARAIVTVAGVASVQNFVVLKALNN